jgi:Pvc16 N-terminal domain
MIGPVHEALRAMLYGDGKIPAGDIDVTFAIPTRDWTASISRPTINFYLHDIVENIKLRESEFEHHRFDVRETQRLRPRRIDLKYVVTVHFKSQLPELEQQEWDVLWRVLATLMRNSEWPDSMLPPEARTLDTSVHAQVAHPEGPRPSEIWTVLGTPPRPSLQYVLTVPLDLNIEYLRTLVLELRVGLGDMVGGPLSAPSSRYGWTLRRHSGEVVAGAEVRLPDAPGFSLSADNGVFTTSLPHAEVRQVMVKQIGAPTWTLIDIVPGSYEAVLPVPGAPLPVTPLPLPPVAAPPAGAAKPLPRRKP